MAKVQLMMFSAIGRAGEGFWGNLHPSLCATDVAKGFQSCTSVLV